MRSGGFGTGKKCPLILLHAGRINELNADDPGGSPFDAAPLNARGLFIQRLNRVCCASVLHAPQKARVKNDASNFPGFTAYAFIAWRFAHPTWFSNISGGCFSSISESERHDALLGVNNQR